MTDRIETGFSFRGSFKRQTRLARSALMALAALVLSGGVAYSADVAINDSTFKCMSNMTKVRHFYVDNLIGNLKETVAVAEAGKGTYPEGSVLQLIPFEAMVKREKGFNPATKDWEFFFLDVTKEGSKINKRGFADVNNGFGMNCFGCHVQAKPEFDMVCEQGHGCDPIPLTRAMFGALQRTDPRCNSTEPVSDDDKKALESIDGAVKQLVAQMKDKK